ncbi:response regulator transcription factor [Streptomyces sp. NPDC088197]|uniref:response regulator transcription factor n=1 Tax=unclassified Streptomyces TaxID=2593676 RepID=UPI0033A92347
MSARVLVAEDDETHAELLQRYLEHEGHGVVVARDGREALDQARRFRPDLLILDVMMPEVDGMDVCRILRRECDVPMLMLTARTDEEDLLLGLGLGADDYVTKPYSPRELMARVRTLLLRSQRSGGWSRLTLHVGGLTVDPARHQVWIDSDVVDCTRGEFEILAAMAAKPDRVFTRAQLLREVSGTDAYTSERTIDMHVMNLRRKTEADPRRPARLVTVFGVGYKLTDGANGRDRTDRGHRAP